MLDKEFQYYKDHQKELVQRYKGKVLVIRQETVVSTHDDQLEAYLDARNKYPAGTFLIQLCMPGKKNYTQTFHSRVTFG